MDHSPRSPTLNEENHSQKAYWLEELSHDITVDDFLLKADDQMQDLSMIDRNLEVDMVSLPFNNLEENAEKPFSLHPPSFLWAAEPENEGFCSANDGILPAE